MTVLRRFVYDTYFLHYVIYQPFTAASCINLNIMKMWVNPASEILAALLSLYLNTHL